MSRRQADAALPPSLVLVDGEHYPPVTARAIAALQAEGERPVAALLVGGGEKLGQVPLECDRGSLLVRARSAFARERQRSRPGSSRG